MIPTVVTVYWQTRFKLMVGRRWYRRSGQFTVYRPYVELMVGRRWYRRSWQFTVYRPYVELMVGRQVIPTVVTVYWQTRFKLMVGRRWNRPSWQFTDKFDSNLWSVDGEQFTDKLKLNAKYWGTRGLCVLSNTKLYHQNLLLWISTKFASWMAKTIFLPSSEQYKT